MKRKSFLPRGQGKTWALFLGLLLAPLANGFCLTAADIMSRARVMMRDNASDTTRQRFSDSQLLEWVNDGQREANSFAWVMQSSYTFTLTGGTTEYFLPSDFQATWRVTYKNRKIDQTSLNQLDAESVQWMNAKGEVQKYYVYLASTPVIGFQPAPVSTSTGTAVVYYLQQPAELTSTSQSPWNGWSQLVPYQSSLAYYVAYRGLWTIGDIDQANRYLEEWNQWVTVMKRGIMQAPDFNPGLQGRRE